MMSQPLSAKLHLDLFEATLYSMALDRARKLAVTRIRTLQRMRKPNANDRDELARLTAALDQLIKLHDHIDRVFRLGGN